MLENIKQIWEAIGQTYDAWIIMLDWVLDFWTYWFPDMILGCIEHTTGIVASFSLQLSLSAAIGNIMPVLAIFFPVGLFLQLVAGLISIMACTLVMKWIIKLVPFIG